MNQSHLPKRPKEPLTEEFANEHNAMYQALKALLVAKAIKFKHGKTDTYKALAAAAWEQAENAIYLVER